MESESRKPDLGRVRRPRSRTEIPDRIVQLIQERYFPDHRTLREIADEVFQLTGHRYDESHIWRIARGELYRHVPHSQRLQDFLERQGD